MFKFLCIPSGMVLVPSFFSPSRFTRVLALHSFLYHLSFRPFSSSLSINTYSAAPLQCLVPPIVRPPSSVRRRATNPPAPANQCPLLVSRPSVPYAGLHSPPRPIRLVVLGLGVGVCGGATETAPPTVVLSPSSRRQASPDRRPSACLRPTLDFPLDYCGPQ